MAEQTEAVKTDEELESEDAAAVAAAEAGDATVDGGDAEDTVEGGERLVVRIGDEAADDDEDEEKLTKVPKFVELRNAHREKLKENAELRRTVEALQGKKVETELGVKPTLESADYDNEKYETALESWIARKSELDAANRVKQEAQAKADAVWQAKVDGYGKAKTEFIARAPDFADAEAVIDESFSKVQRGIILKVAKDAPLFFYALFKNEAKLKELAAITDPVEFTWASAQLETQMKVSSKPNEFKPETRPAGVRVVNGGNDAVLAKLRAEAVNTGDYSKVIAHNKAVKARQQKSA